MLDGNGLGPLDSALGVWLKIPETLHQWLWMGKGSFVWDWGRLQPQCMHPTQRSPGTRGPQRAPRPTMHSCSGRHLAQGAPHPETGTLTQEWMPLPPGVRDALGGGPLPPHGGRLGTGPASQAVPSGRASLHPDLWLPCRHSACILGLQTSMCCPRQNTPKPWDQAAAWQPTPLPRLSVSPPPSPRCDVWAGTPLLSHPVLYMKVVKGLKLHEKGRGWAGPGGHNASLQRVNRS